MLNRFDNLFGRYLGTAKTLRLGLFPNPIGSFKGQRKSRFKPGEDMVIAMDAAVSEFYDEKEKMYVSKNLQERKKLLMK